MTFARAWDLWRSGPTRAPGDLFPAWRLHDLEASLRRDQRQFGAALSCLDRALAQVPAAEAGHVLLNKQFILVQAGELDAALAVLDEAAPHVARHPIAGLGRLTEDSDGHQRLSRESHDHEERAG